MRLNIAHKIFGIAVVILVLMICVAVLSGRLTARISAELNNIAYKQLPLSNEIGELNVRILEQGLLIQRLFALPGDPADSLDRIKELGAEIDHDFKENFELFEREEQSANPPPGIFELHKALKRVEGEYRKLQRDGLELVRLHANKDSERFHALLVDFNQEQNAVDQEVAALREYMEKIAEDAVKRSDRDERFLLYFNSGLTGLAVILGIGFSSLVTYILVRNVRILVRAAEAVEEGNLDTEVPPLSRDEIGRLGLSFNDMVDGLRLKERIKDMFGKYMDPRIVSRLLENPEFARMGGTRQEMTVMFIDLKGYTTLSENLEPPELLDVINLFLSSMTQAVSNRNGVINDFLGDAVMAFWGPPFTKPDEHAALACDAARDAILQFQSFRDQVREKLGARADHLDLDMRIGISTGEMIAGNIGSLASKKYSVIGDPVNLGARLEGANKVYGTRIMASNRTRELALDRFKGRELDLIKVKGKSAPTRVYELFEPDLLRPDLSHALAAYRRQDWTGANAAFEQVLAQDPDDPVAQVFLFRTAQLQAKPPEADWDGVWELQEK
ncbi:adenylate/guanylate cyclase domain-containing protein [Aestuariispira insulae]|uniref:Adenylate cyclase n=1 Tax=Aestuariispira insulae TaxID=1461337 RepID=A0A3D9H9I6_9PROT|nr:adenylate/guanylate cyclase domain-containing protein [Aestuariispira insulae]RED46145.1 adenylate cyclase [Aestuariispira insulae]